MRPLPHAELKILRLILSTPSNSEQNLVTKIDTIVAEVKYIKYMYVNWVDSIRVKILYFCILRPMPMYSTTAGLSNY